MLVDVDRVGLPSKVVRLDDLALTCVVALCVVPEPVLPRRGSPPTAAPEPALGALDRAVLAQDVALCALLARGC